MYERMIGSFNYGTAVVNFNTQNPFTATGQTLKFDGFRRVYFEGRDDTADEDAESMLPTLSAEQVLRLGARRDELDGDDFKGKVVFLNFWATWCEPCREEMPSMERLHRAYKDRGLVVLAISLDSQGASVVNPFVKKFAITFPVGLDPKMAVRESYGVWAVPSTFILDRQGKRVLFANGAREWDGKSAHAVIESLLK